MNTILIDTCSMRINLGIASSNKIAASLSLDCGLKHSENLVSSLLFLSEKTGIELNECRQIICSGGPGSFTGLRIGISTAKGLCMGAKAQLKLVPSLDTYVDQEWETNNNIPLYPIIDARKKRFYTALYLNGIRQEKDQDLTIEEIIEKISNFQEIHFCGPDCNELFARLPESVKNEKKIIVRENNGQILYNLLKRGSELIKNEGYDHFGIGPFYLRKSEAEINLEKRELS